MYTSYSSALSLSWAPTSCGHVGQTERMSPTTGWGSDKGRSGSVFTWYPLRVITHHHRVLEHGQHRDRCKFLWCTSTPMLHAKRCNAFCTYEASNALGTHSCKTMAAHLLPPSKLKSAVERLRSGIMMTSSTPLQREGLKWETTHQNASNVASHHMQLVPNISDVPVVDVPQKSSFM